MHASTANFSQQQVVFQKFDTWVEAWSAYKAVYTLGAVKILSEADEEVRLLNLTAADRTIQTPEELRALKRNFLPGRVVYTVTKGQRVGLFAFWYVILPSKLFFKFDAASGELLKP